MRCSASVSCVLQAPIKTIIVCFLGPLCYSIDRPTRGLVVRASASVLVRREFNSRPDLTKTLPRPCKLVLQPYYQAHGVQKSCREHNQNTKTNQKLLHTIIGQNLWKLPSTGRVTEIVQSQSWRYKTIVVIQRQHQTTVSNKQYSWVFVFIEAAIKAYMADTSVHTATYKDILWYLYRRRVESKGSSLWQCYRKWKC